MTPSSTLTGRFLQRLHSAPSEPGLALLFPGQGSQQVGMGDDLCRSFPTARDLFQEADSILGLPLSRFCFQGPEEELQQTANAQPAILVTSLACLAAAVEAGTLTQRPALLAGHSLGEYTALVAAASLSFEDALRLVRERGRLMQEAGQAQRGTMAAIMGLAEDAAEELCRESGAQPCNYNSPGQVVVGGSLEAVERACSLARDRGGKAVPLRVSGAFHTSLMAPAAAAFARAVDTVPIADPAVPVVANATATPLKDSRSIRGELKEQMLRPVLWQQTLTAMAAAGVSTFVEVGPGRVLSSLVKRTVPGPTVRSIDGAAALSGASHV